MRDLINLLTQINEDEGPNPQELEAFKNVIASKIKVLPADDATAKTLREIEELLQHVNAGGRMGMIRGQLHAINDPAVMAAQKRLAQYIASMEASPEDRAELFRLWRADKLVNVDKLLSKDQCTFSEVFAQYGKNSAITEFVDDVMTVADLGQGKGEFGLNVLSKSVAKPGGLGEFTAPTDQEDDEHSDETKGKGDLIVKHNSKWRKVECKTTHGGGARFSDQEVRPAEGYETASRELQRFVEQFKGTEMYKTVLPKGMAKGYGLNFRSAVELYSNWFKQGKYGDQYLAMVEKVITLIFGGNDADKKRIAAIMKAFKSGDSNEAIQQYAQASFNFYMSKKDDDGVLAINLNDRTFVFYSNADDLTKQKLRFNADTIYLTAVDAARGAYPQMSVVKTTFGANARAKAEDDARKLAIKTAKKNPVPFPKEGQPPKELNDAFKAYVKNLGEQNDAFNLPSDTVQNIVNHILDMHSVGMTESKIKKEIVNMYFNPDFEPPAEEPSVAPAVDQKIADLGDTTNKMDLRPKAAQKRREQTGLAENLGRARRTLW